MKKYKLVLMLVVLFCVNTIAQSVSHLQEQSSASKDETKAIWYWPLNTQNRIQGYKIYERDVSNSEVFVTDSKNITCYRSFGAVFKTNWPYTLPSGYSFPFLCNPAVGDIDGDNDPDVIAIATNYALDKTMILAFDMFGVVKPNYPKIIDTRYQFYLSPMLADVDGNGNLEIIIPVEYTSSNTYGVMCFDGQGNELWSYLNCVNDVLGIACGDLLGDDNGIPEIVIQDETSIRMLNGDGSLIRTATQPFQNVRKTDHIILADLNDDGKTEIITMGMNKNAMAQCYINVLSNNLQPANSGWPKIIAGVESGTAVGDVDNDGFLDVVFAEESGTSLTSKMIQAYNYYGDSRTGFPILTDGSLYMNCKAITIARLNEDEYPELILTPFRSDTPGYHIYSRKNNSYALKVLPLQGKLYYFQPILNDLDFDGQYEFFHAIKNPDNSYSLINQKLQETADFRYSYTTQAGFNNFNTWECNKRPDVSNNLDGWFKFESLINQNQSNYIKNEVNGALFLANDTYAAGRLALNNRIFQHSYAYAQNNSEFDYANSSFTVACWYRYPGTIVEKLNDVSKKGYSLSVEDNYSSDQFTIKLELYDGGQPHVFTKTYEGTSTYQNWKFLAVVVNRLDPSKSFICLNNSATYFNVSSVNAIGPTYSPFMIGSLISGSPKMDELMIFDRCLSKKELNSIFMAGRKGCKELVAKKEVKSSAVKSEDLDSEVGCGSSFKIYPNPAKDVLTLHNVLVSNAEIRIYNIGGLLVTREEMKGNKDTFEMNVSTLENGVYIVVIQSGDEIQTEKLIINR